MSLTEQLKQTQEKLEGRFDKETVELMHKETKNLKLSNMLENTLNVGNVIPNFSLVNHLGETVELYDLLEEKNLVITFYRGSWCPYCNLELQALNKALGDIEEHHASLVAISAQTPDNSLSTSEKLELNFQVLSDENNKYAKELGLVFSFSPELENLYKEKFGLSFELIYGQDEYELAIPATFVVDSQRVVRYAFLDVDYTKRADPKDIVEALKQI